MHELIYRPISVKNFWKFHTEIFIAFKIYDHAERDSLIKIYNYCNIFSETWYRSILAVLVKNVFDMKISRQFYTKISIEKSCQTRLLDRNLESALRLRNVNQPILVSFRENFLKKWRWRNSWNCENVHCTLELSLFWYFHKKFEPVGIKQNFKISKT